MQNNITILYALIGEAVWQIQRLEEALSRSITLKKDVKTPNCMLLIQADEIFTKYHALTLGKAINTAKEAGIYSDSLQQSLKGFLEERNWLIHKCMIHHIDDMRVEESRNILFHRIKSVHNNAKTLEDAITEDLMDFTYQQGLDMSHVQAAIRKHSRVGLV
ncbi:MAG: hypothetical protein AB7F28_06020 [Candidatus Margulisiibacteriota bacterium]